MKPWYLRLFLWVFTTICYRVEVLAADRLPARGGALLVSNHVSFVDMLLILASTRRFVRFVLPEEVCALPWLRPWLKVLRVIPLPARQRAGDLDRALGQAADAIRNGEVVGIFAERNVSRIGIMLPFRREFERIMEGLDAPVIPVCLDGVWGSIFSYHSRKFFWKLPRRLPYAVSVSFGEPMPGSVKAFEVRTAIQRLNSNAWACRRRTMPTLGRAFLSCARHHPFRFAMGDTRVPKLSFGSLLIKTIFLARRLKRDWEDQPTVGIFLPPSVAGAMVNLAALLAGKTVVNLNYTLSAETIASCARQAGLKMVVSSKAFLDRLKLPLPWPVIVLEELAAKPRASEKLIALTLAWLAPARLLEKALGCASTPQLDDLGAIVFSSGSTGDPKGIMLSHYNLQSNAQQLGQAFDFRPQDRFLGVLPFFHSFGFMATLLVPALEGIGVVFHPNPLEGRPVGELVRRFAVSYLMATPAFLQIYLRSCEPQDFGSVRFILTGAEKLPEWLADAFHQKFAIRPVQGYGCTECSPAVAVNTHDYRSAGIVELGSRRGSIGHPMPGISVRIVDPDTFEPVTVGQPGLLLVCGPNVMKGYLHRPDKTAEVLRDGWYNTGDIAALDEDGFLQITDRLSRFSKIGGEMVPHIKVEEELHKLAGVSEQTFAVTGVPDERKGERLAVLHRLSPEALDELLKRLPSLNLPNLWMPRPNQFHRADPLPLTGTGKLDLKKIREIAARLSAETPVQAGSAGGKQ